MASPTNVVNGSREIWGISDCGQLMGQQTEAGLASVEASQSRDASKSRRSAKLLQPSPMSETWRPDFPSERCLTASSGAGSTLGRRAAIRRDDC